MSTRLRYLVTILAIILAGSIIAPSSYAQNRIFQVLSPDNSSRAFLGISMADVTEENMSEYKLDSVQGVIIQSVEEGSPAESADLKERDVLLEFDGLKIRSTLQLARLVKETPVGRKLEILISRAGKRENVTVRLAERDDRQADSRIERTPTPFGEFLGDRGFLSRPPDSPGWNSNAPGRRTPTLGVEILPLTEQLATFLGVPGKKGVLVSSVVDGSPSSGKLKTGDVIIRAEGKDVGTPEDVIDLLRNETGDTLTFQVIRDKKEITVKVNLPSEDGKKIRL